MHPPRKHFRAIDGVAMICWLAADQAISLLQVAATAWIPERFTEPSISCRAKSGCVGWTDPHSGPRIHDLRHRFAIQTLIAWYRSGEDVERRLPILSTYLGHVHVADTYWYLSACPQLMGHAVTLLEQHWEQRS